MASQTGSVSLKARPLECTIILGRAGAVEADRKTPSAHKVMLDLIPQLPLALLVGGNEANIRILNLDTVTPTEAAKTLARLDERGIDPKDSPILFRRSTKKFFVKAAACYELCFLVDELGHAPPELELVLFGAGNPVAKMYHHGPRFMQLQRKHARTKAPIMAFPEAAERAVAVASGRRLAGPIPLRKPRRLVRGTAAAAEGPVPSPSVTADDGPAEASARPT